MTINNSIKNKVLTILALILFLFTRWVFLLIEINAAVDTVYYIAEGIFIVLVYSISLFNIPKIINGAVTIFGCAGLCIYSFCLDGAVTVKTFYPLTLLPVFLFYISQYKSKSEGNSRVGVIWKVLMAGYMIGFPAIIGYVIFQGMIESGKISAFAIFIFVAVMLVYNFVMIQLRAKKSRRNKSKNKKYNMSRQNEKSTNDRWMSFGFLFAVISLLETGVFLVMVKDDTMVHIVPLLWIINLLFLYDQGHPAVCRSAEISRKMFIEPVIGS